MGLLGGCFGSAEPLTPSPAWLFALDLKATARGEATRCSQPLNVSLNIGLFAGDDGGDQFNGRRQPHQHGSAHDDAHQREDDRGNQCCNGEVVVGLHVCVQRRNSVARRRRLGLTA